MIDESNQGAGSVRALEDNESELRADAEAIVERIGDHTCLQTGYGQAEPG